MNYYEELGIANTASSDEVRHAYRNLARLLHPDQQTDETLRRLAGLQMARINKILEILADPILRERYDDSLRRHKREVTAEADCIWSHRTRAEEREARFGRDSRWSRFAWPGAGLIGIGLAVVFLAQDGAVQRPAGTGEGRPAGEQMAADSGSGAWPVRTGGRLAARAPKLESAGDQADPLNPAGSGTDDTAPGRPHAVASEYDNRMTPGAYSRRAEAASTGEMAGAWYYAKPGKLDDVEGMCPPVYIDLEIAETGGRMSGKYSARYQVGGRAISPFVEFEFAGKAGQAAELGWKGSGGAAGRVRLTLVSPRQLRVEWNADQVGEELGLASGRATLVRRMGN